VSDIQCEQHGGVIKNADGDWVCCRQQEWSIDSFGPKDTAPARLSVERRAELRAVAGIPTREGAEK
jgi:hypothetical protein